MDAVVAIVSVVFVEPPLGGVTGLVEKLAALQVGSDEPVPVTLQVRLTGELNPLTEDRVTVELPGFPGFTAGGVVAAMPKFVCVYFATNASVPPPLATCFGD